MHRDDQRPDDASGGATRPKRVARVLALAMLVLTSMTLAVGHRATVDTRRAQARAAAARAGGDRLQEIVERGRVIRAFSFGRDAASQASAELAELGEGAERAGDAALAREAWRELRSAWFAVRGLGDPGHAWIERAGAALTRLGAPREAAIEPRLAQPMSSLVAFVALLGWCGAGFGLIRFGMDATGRLRARPAAPWLIGVVVGLAIWVAALRLA
ncbi:MAG: hypothetical protein U0610_10945 [bacterium]